MSDEIPEQSPINNINIEHVRFGLIISIIGLIVLLFGAKPEWFGMDRSPVVGFIQTNMILIGLGILCIGGYIGLSNLWGTIEKSITADIGIRLVGTGYVIALFSGLADVFGMNMQELSDKKPFFGPWQQAGMELGTIVIIIGLLMIIPYQLLRGEHNKP